MTASQVHGTARGVLRRTSAPPPVRIVHLGLGAFHRAHQAWFTWRASDSASWGIAAYTNSSTALPQALTSQDCLYTVIERTARGDQAEVVGSVVRAHSGEERASLLSDIAVPTTAIVTLTITEPGYLLGSDGWLNLDDPRVVADVRRVKAACSAPNILSTGEWPASALGRLLLGLEHRRQAGSGPLAVVSCDNVAANGEVLREAIHGLARAAVPELSEWLSVNVTFPSTSVDRITPRSSGADIDLVQQVGRCDDAVPVVTEGFADWTLEDDFPAGRPDWESAGARFVRDVQPYERRKLWMLNGAHTALAVLGLERGWSTVAEAMGDEDIVDQVTSFWRACERHLPPEVEPAAYADLLLERFGNIRIEHGLAQISDATVDKLRMRVVPVTHRERALGRPAAASAQILGAWLRAVAAGHMPPAVDSTLGMDDRDSVRTQLAGLDATLGRDAEFVARVAVEVAHPPVRKR